MTTKTKKVLINENSPLAMQLMRNTVSIEERASSFFESSRRNIQRDVIDQLISQKEKIEDKLFELKDFSLSTDLNRGMKRITKEEIESRFKEIISNEYELLLISEELKQKQILFDKYFV